MEPIERELRGIEHRAWLNNAAEVALALAVFALGLVMLWVAFVALFVGLVDVAMALTR